MKSLFLHEIYGNIISTVITMFILGLIFLIIDFLFARKIDNNRKRRQFRIRSFYLTCFIFIFLLARIWVEGFTHFLAILGLVSAALVISNKETIMNFVGWLVINWRGLFSEDDFIQIQHYKGYVKSFGLLYFTLAEISDRGNGNVTGRLIRIPNGLVANNALINFSQNSHLLEQVFTTIISQECDPDYSINLLTMIVSDVVSSFYKNTTEYSMEYIKRNHKYLSDKIKLDVKVLFHVKLSKPTGFELSAHYYCFPEDAEKIQQSIALMLLKKAKDDDKIKLSFED